MRWSSLAWGFGKPEKKSKPRTVLRDFRRVRSRDVESSEQPWKMPNSAMSPAIRWDSRMMKS